MMLRCVCTTLLVAVSAPAADDGWSRVIELKSGTELRIFKKGATQPVLVRMDEANEERIVIVLKNEQTAIPKDEIDRLDRRPEQKGSRVRTESKVTTEQPGARADLPMPKSGGKSAGHFNIFGTDNWGQATFRDGLPPPSRTAAASEIATIRDGFRAT